MSKPYINCHATFKTGVAVAIPVTPLRHPWRGDTSKKVIYPLSLKICSKSRRRRSGYFKRFQGISKLWCTCQQRLGGTECRWTGVWLAAFRKVYERGWRQFAFLITPSFLRSRDFFPPATEIRQKFYWQKSVFPMEYFRVFWPWGLFSNETGVTPPVGVRCKIPEVFKMTIYHPHPRLSFFGLSMFVIIKYF